MKPNITNEEWDRIVRDAFAPDAPDPEFSRAYCARKRSMERMLTMKEHRRFSPGFAAAFAACLLVAAVPLGMIAAMQTNSPKTPRLDPGQAVEGTPPADFPEEIPPSEQTEPPAEETLPETPVITAGLTQTDPYQYLVTVDPAALAGDAPLCGDICDVQFSWLPEGMHPREDGKIHDNGDTDRGISPEFLRIADGKVCTVAVQFVESAEAFTLGNGNQVYWLRKANAGWDQVWLAFKGTPYFVSFFVTGIPDEEVQQVLDGLTLVPSDTETAYLWTGEHNQTPQSADAAAPHPAAPGTYGTVDLANTELLHIGDTIHCSDGYDMCITAARLQTDFTGLDRDAFGSPADFSQFLDETGQITAKRTLWCAGNGVDTLDRIVSEETVQQYILAVDVTYTNTAQTAQGINLSGRVFSAGDGYIRDGEYDFSTGYAYEYDGILSPNGTEISLIAQEQYLGDEDHLRIPAGESIQVTEGFLVDADWLGHLYLQPTNAYDVEVPERLYDLTDLRLDVTP